MEKNRKEFHEKIMGQKVNPNDPNSPLIMSKEGKQFSYSAMVSTFFNNLDSTKNHFSKLQKVVNKTDDTNWIKRLLPNHISFYKDEETFIKSYACDLSWATTLPYCKQDNSNQPISLDDYTGFYTGLDEDGKTMRQEMVIDGNKLATSLKKKPAGNIKVFLTPTATKDLFSVEMKNMMIKTSSGTAVFKRNKDGKVCSVTSNVKLTAINGEDMEQSATATKEGVSCDEPTPVPDNQGQNGGQQNGSQQQQTQDGFPICVALMSSVSVYLVMDKSNNKPFSFAHDDDEANAKKIAEKIIADNPTKQLELKLEDGMLDYIDKEFRIGSSYPKTNKIIFFKDNTFVSDANIKRGKYECVKMVNPRDNIQRNYIQITQKERTINEHQAKEILKKYFIRLTK